MDVVPFDLLCVIGISQTFFPAATIFFDGQYEQSFVGANERSKLQADDILNAQLKPDVSAFLGTEQ